MSKHNKYYIDVTKKWLNNVKHVSHTVRELPYFEHNNKRYYVDGKNVVLDYSKKELEMAYYLENALGGEIYMLPRVNNPEGIKTADYLWNNEYWDLKIIYGNGKNIFFHAIEDNEKQSHNYIFDITNSVLKDDEVVNLLNKLYVIEKVKWLDKIIVKRNEEIIIICEKIKKK